MGQSRCTAYLRGSSEKGEQVLSILLKYAQPSLVTRPGYFSVVAAVLLGVAGLVFNGEITAGPQGV